MQYWGFKRLHGEIWLNVYLSKEPIDASTLAKRLSVSKASMSLALKDLFKYNVIIPHSKGEKRTLFLAANPDISKVIADVLRSREKMMLEKVGQAVQEISSMTLDEKTSMLLNEQNLQNLEEMVQSADLALNLLLDCDFQNPEFLKKCQ